MTMLDGAASLSVYSDSHSAADVTIALGMAPDHSAERGDPRPNGPYADGMVRPQRYWKYSFWSIDIRADDVAETAPDDDTAGFTSLVTLVDRLLPVAPVLAELRVNYDTDIRWHGTSGSSQGGFVMPIELIQGLAALGCSLFGNVHSYDEGDDERG